MSPLKLAAPLALAAGMAQAQPIIAMPDNAYDCAFVLENMEKDQRLRSFMIDYTLGVVSGLNMQRKMSGMPVLDLGPIHNPMFVTWTYQSCEANPDSQYVVAVLNVFNALLDRQGGG